MQRVGNFSAIQRQGGVGLIEILIAVLVLSIGFLGIAALQTKALANNNSAMIRTQASIAAYSMFDAMRADRANALAGNYNQTVTVGACPAGGGSLTQAQLATWCWGFDPANPPAGYSTGNPPPGSLVGGLAALGAGATGDILCQPIGGSASNCRIRITFDDSKATGTPATQPNLVLDYWTQL